MHNMQHINYTATDATENQLIAIWPPANALLFPAWNQWKRFRHVAQALAAIINLGNKSFSAGRIIKFYPTSNL
jgi:hypothetical protein